MTRPARHALVSQGSPRGRHPGAGLAGLDAAVVLEFATRDDPMVQRLMRNKRASDVHPDYDGQRLRDLLAERFEIRRETALPSGHRTLFALSPRS